MRILKGYKAHWITNKGDALLSLHNSVYTYDYKNDKLTKELELDYSNPFFNLIKFTRFEQLNRGGIHHIIPTNGTYVIFFDKKIFTYSNKNIESIFNIESCKRPLNVCYNNSDQTLVWGDYIAGNERFPINIYSSNDKGKTWKIIYSFPKNKIRHIHNIIYDEYRNNYLILTGDKDEESGIWWTKDFNKLEPLLIGKQRYRATSLIVTPEGLIIPTDTELEKNYIQQYTFTDGSCKPTLNIPSSSIGAANINNNLFISTMVEPSDVNKCTNVNLYFSNDGRSWHNILTVEKSLWAGKYFQYSSIQIPKYDNGYKNTWYYFNIINSKNNNGVIIISDNEIADIIGR